MTSAALTVPVCLPILSDRHPILTHKAASESRNAQELCRDESSLQATAQPVHEPHLRPSLSFSNHGDEAHTRSAASYTVSSSHYQPNSGLRMRKSLRRCNTTTGNTRPLTLKPIVTPPPIIPKGVASASGSLRKTASKMGKAVRSRLKELWGHSRSEDGTDEFPEQHIRAQRSHGSLAFSNRGASPRPNFDSETPEHEDCVTSVRDDGGGYPDEDYDRQQSGSGTGTSRFTSWSSSVRQTSSSASQNAYPADSGHEQLSAISEGNSQPLPFPTRHQHRLDMASHGLQTATLTYEVNPRDSPILLPVQPQPGLALGTDSQPPIKSTVSAHSSATSSPSLAGSGRDDTPRQGITPSALWRLQELSLGLQEACLRRDNAEKKARETGQTGTDNDPFYDGKTEEVRYAFMTAPTTPDVAAKQNEAQTMTPKTDGGCEPFTPQFLFRGGSPYRRALRQSMKQTESIAAAAWGRSCHDADEKRQAVSTDEDADDAPLLRPHGVGQWSRVQA